ncbi:MAG: hypothetical protein VX938_13875, partial [Myxococcota bacterium]|nr:hypothetical protein [Myxococcota bacterium]
MGIRIWPFLLVVTMTLGCGDSSNSSGPQASGVDIGFPLFDANDGGAPPNSGDAGPGELEISETGLA